MLLFPVNVPSLSPDPLGQANLPFLVTGQSLFPSSSNFTRVVSDVTFFRRSSRARLPERRIEAGAVGPMCVTRGSGPANHWGPVTHRTPPLLEHEPPDGSGCSGHLCIPSTSQYACLGAAHVSEDGGFSPAILVTGRRI